MKLFEVKKHGVTIEMTFDLREAEDRFKKAAPGEVQMFHIADGFKKLLRVK